MKSSSVGKVVSVALACTLAFGMAGCSEEKKETDVTGSASIGSTAPGDGPLGIETSSLYDDTMDEGVLKEFSDEKYGTKAGIEEALKTYEELNSISEFWSPRDSSQDMKHLEPFEDRFLDTAYGELELQVKDYGQINALFVLSGEGVLIDTKENGETVEYTVSKENPPSNTFSVSSIRLSEDKTSVVISGVRTWKYFTDGPTFTGTNDFSMEITPVDGEWKISSMDWSNLSSRVE